MSTKRTIDNDPMYSPGERAVYHATVKACFLRAADVIDRITEDDVLHAQAEMLRSGATLSTVVRLDRALLASTHFRAIANGDFKE